MTPYNTFTAHPEDLRWGLLASSMIDVVMRPSQFVVYHSYTSNRLPGVDVVRIDHGSGDEVLVFFDATRGCLVKGFDHESDMSPHARDDFSVWPGLFDETPPELLAHLDDPGFRKEETTFCIWRRKGDRHWWQGDVTDSEKGEWSSYLFRSSAHLDVASYFDWASEYHGLSESAREAVTRVFASCRLDRSTALAMNPNADLKTVENELAKLGIALQ